MNKQILMATLLATVLAAPAMAANDTYNATMQTGAKSQPFPTAAAVAVQADVPVSAPGAASGLPASEVAAATPPAEAAATAVAPQAEVVPMPAMGAASTVVAPAPILGAAPMAATTTTVATTQEPMPMPAMQAATNVTTQAAPMPPVIGAPMPAPAVDNPLCAAVAATPHTPSADVAAAGSPPAVNPPRTIPLSVDLAGALGIQGFQNIVSEGPIGFITVDQGGRVFFEGRELTQNAQNLCASGNVPPAGVASSARAPDGSAYASMPGQGGMRTAAVATAGTGFSRMQPIVDGPSYKTPPKKKAAKKAAPKPKVDDTVTEETVAPEATPSASEAATTSVMPASEAEGMPAAPSGNDEADLKSMMRKPGATETAPGAEPVPMAPKTTPGAEPAATAEPAPTEPQTGAAVQEVLEN